MRQHYHVIENTPGYLPDSEPATFTNRREANRYAAGLAAELREDGYHVYGSAESGLYSAERSASDLGRAIEVTPCTESDCLDSGY